MKSLAGIGAAIAVLVAQDSAPCAALELQHGGVSPKTIPGRTIVIRIMETEDPGKLWVDADFPDDYISKMDSILYRLLHNPELEASGVRVRDYIREILNHRASGLSMAAERVPVGSSTAQNL